MRVPHDGMNDPIRRGRDARALSVPHEDMARQRQLQARKTVVAGNQISQHLRLRLPASRTVRN